MPEEKTLKIDSIVRPHVTKACTLGLIESVKLAEIIGMRVTEIKYQPIEPKECKIKKGEINHGINKS